MKLSSKSKNRIELLDVITEGISTQEVFKTINYKNQSEDKIIQFIFPHLVEELTQWVMEKKSAAISELPPMPEPSEDFPFGNPLDDGLDDSVIGGSQF